MDASIELIRAVKDHLRTTLAVTALVGERIYDRVPERQDGTINVEFPYISLGPSASTPDDYDCLTGEEITIQLDCWTSGSGVAYSTVECRQIANAVKRALHNAELILAVNALVTLSWAMTRIIDDPNPSITHGVVQLTATVETP